MIGIHSETGKHLSGREHLFQSVRDILTTPIGSRVMRREYGSQLFELIDRPLNRSGLMDVYAATADALARWEPRIRVQRVLAAMSEPGKLQIDVYGLLVDGSAVELRGIEVTA